MMLMNKEDREFLEKLQRDIDYRFQKIKEQNFDLQNKMIELQKIMYLVHREKIIILGILRFDEKIKDWFRRRIRHDESSL